MTRNFSLITTSLEYDKEYFIQFNKNDLIAVKVVLERFEMTNGLIEIIFRIIKPEKLVDSEFHLYFNTGNGYLMNYYTHEFCLGGESDRLIRRFHKNKVIDYKYVYIYEDITGTNCETLYFEEGGDFTPSNWKKTKVFSLKEHYQLLRDNKVGFYDDGRRFETFFYSIANSKRGLNHIERDYKFTIGKGLFKCEFPIPEYIEKLIKEKEYFLRESDAKSVLEELLING